MVGCWDHEQNGVICRLLFVGSGWVGSGWVGSERPGLRLHKAIAGTKRKDVAMGKIIIFCNQIDYIAPTMVLRTRGQSWKHGVQEADGEIHRLGH